MSEPEASTHTPDAAPAPPVTLRDLTDTQRNEWLKTGELPTAKAEPETEAGKPSAASAPPDDSPVGETQPPVEPVKAKPAKPRDDIQARLGQLAEQRRLEKDRADKAERELAELRAGRVTPQPEPVTAPVTPKPQTHLELVKRYQSEPDWPTLQQAIDAGFEDPYQAVTNAQNLYIQDKLSAERERTAQERTIRERAETHVDRTMRGLREEFPEADPSVLVNLAGQSAPVFAQLLFESPLSVKLLNYFSNDPAEARRVAAMEPLAAAHALGMVEQSLSTSAPSRVATPTKTVSSAPEPTLTLGSRHTPQAGDPVEQALKDRDTGRYIEEANQREFAAMKAGRR